MVRENTQPPRRSELRHLPQWFPESSDESLNRAEFTIKLPWANNLGEVPSEVTYMQIHQDQNVPGVIAGGSPVFRFAWIDSRSFSNDPDVASFWSWLDEEPAPAETSFSDYLWAIFTVPNDVSGEKGYVKVPLLPRSDSDFTEIELRVRSGLLTVIVDHKPRVSFDLSQWAGRPLYFKNGVYLNKDGGRAQLSVRRLTQRIGN